MANAPSPSQHPLAAAQASADRPTASDCPGLRVAVLTTPAGLRVVNQLHASLDLVGVVIDQGASHTPDRRGFTQTAKDVAKAALRLAGRPDDLYAQPPQPPPRKTWQQIADAGVALHHTPNANDPDAVAALKSWSADLGVVVGGRILKPRVFQAPRLGVLNKHASLLPRARGLAAEYWCLYHGDLDAIGLTVHFVEPGCDTGPIVLQRPIPFEPGDTPGTLRAKSDRLGAEALVDAVRMIDRTGCRGDAQDELHATRNGRPTPQTDRELRAKLPELWQQARDRQAHQRQAHHRRRAARVAA